MNIAGPDLLDPRYIIRLQHSMDERHSQLLNTRHAMILTTTAQYGASDTDLVLISNHVFISTQMILYLFIFILFSFYQEVLAPPPGWTLNRCSWEGRLHNPPCPPQRFLGMFVKRSPVVVPSPSVTLIILSSYYTLLSTQREQATRVLLTCFQTRGHDSHQSSDHL